MNLIVIYHSGAGSTKYIAELFYNALKKCGHSADISAVERCRDVNFEHYDGAVIGFPTYHASPSPSISKFIQSIPAAKNNLPVYLFTTCGWYSANSLRILAKSCLKKNLVTVGSRSFRAPASDGVLLIPQCKGFMKFEKNITHKVEQCAKNAAELFAAGEVKLNLPRWKFYSLLNYPNKLAGQYLYKPKIYVNNDVCVKCGKCVSDCANGCISLVNGRIILNQTACEHCYRCIHHCPKGALSLNKNGQTRVQLNDQFFKSL